MKNFSQIFSGLDYWNPLRSFSPAVLSTNFRTRYRLENVSFPLRIASPLHRLSRKMGCSKKKNILDICRNYLSQQCVSTSTVCIIGQFRRRERWRRGWIDFWEKELDPCYVVTNCYGSPVLKFPLHMCYRASENVNCFRK